MAFVITGEPLPEPAPIAPPLSGNVVGGKVFTVDKIGLIAPWIATGIVILAAGIFLVRRRAHSHK